VTVLETPRVRFTTWRPADIDDLHALHADPNTMRYMNSGVEDEAQVQTRLDGYLREQIEFGWTRWRLEDQRGAMIGRAGFRLADDQQHRELGYLLAPSVWGRGLATEVALALTQWHFDHPDPRVSAELRAYAEVENAASRRVLEKVGFTLDPERSSARACYVSRSRP
jgi:ribosomal-protein-alanine N-acetyltransferase